MIQEKQKETTETRLERATTATFRNRKAARYHCATRPFVDIWALSFAP